MADQYLVDHSVIAKELAEQTAAEQTAVRDLENEFLIIKTEMYHDRNISKDPTLFYRTT